MNRRTFERNLVIATAAMFVVAVSLTVYQILLTT